MRAFLDWFNEPPSGLDGLVRAGIAHAWFELVHPFEDGNGRVGRALMDMALAQDETALNASLQTNKKYAHLTGASPATAQRDLADLVSKGYLELRGAARSARYELATTALDPNR